MIKLLEISNEELELVIQNTADKFNMSKAIVEKNFENIELLKSVINFKKKFYASNWAKYDDIMNANLKLIPLKEGLEIFSKDYDNMKNMLFGDKIPFDKIINTLKEYEKELNFIIKNKYNFGNRP